MASRIWLWLGWRRIIVAALPRTARDGCLGSGDIKILLRDKSRNVEKTVVSLSSIRHGVVKVRLGVPEEAASPLHR